MKLNFETKLGIAILLVFAVVITGFVAWTPMQVKYYASKLHSKDKDERLAGLNGLIKLGDTGKKALADFCGSKEEGDFIYLVWSGNYPSHPDPTGFRNNRHLCISASKNYIHAAGYLLDNGAGIDEGLLSAPLRDAAGAGHFRMVRFLLEHGADINHSVFFFGSPIAAAAENGNLKMVRYLIEKGADVNAHSSLYGDNRITGEIEETPLETALDCAKTDEMKELLRAHGAKTSAELRAEAEKK